MGSTWRDSRQCSPCDTGKPDAAVLSAKNASLKTDTIVCVHIGPHRYSFERDWYQAVTSNKRPSERCED